LGYRTQARKQKQAGRRTGNPKRPLSQCTLQLRHLLERAELADSLVSGQTTATAPSVRCHYRALEAGGRRESERMRRRSLVSSREMVEATRFGFCVTL